MEVRVPEVFTKYISSFSGCMGGNPGAPIWMCIDHSCRTPDVIAPSFFDTPVEDISGLQKGLLASCPVSSSIAALVNDIVGQPAEDVGKVFNENDPKAQSILTLAVSPFSFGDNPVQNWKAEKVIEVDGKKLSFAEYTGLPEFKDYWDFLIAQRGKVFAEAAKKYAPKVIICEGINKYKEYFKLWQADLTNVRAHDAFYYAPIIGMDGKPVGIVFATDLFGTSNGIDNTYHIERIALQIRHFAVAELGNKVFGSFVGPNF